MTTQALKVRDVAQRVALSPCAVYVAIQRGELPCIRFGRAVRVLEADLDTWIEQHRSTANLWTDEQVALLMAEADE